MKELIGEFPSKLLATRLESRMLEPTALPCLRKFRHRLLIHSLRLSPCQRRGAGFKSTFGTTATSNIGFVSWRNGNSDPSA